MDSKKILTIQDISCVGQCSLTVALPVLSACGLETCVIPTAVLSTHTAFKEGYTLLDLSDEMNPISLHWKKEKIFFSALYTGYLSSPKQINEIITIKQRNIEKEGILIVDPAMADHGKLYPGFEDSFPLEMLKLCQLSDVVLPNITEACLLTNTPYQEKYNKDYIENLMLKMQKLGMKNIIITGVSFAKEKIGVAIYENSTQQISYYFVKKQPLMSHGTGDLFASSFVGTYLQGKSLFDSAMIAARFTARAIKDTVHDKKHWYGVHFEQNIPYLLSLLKK